MAGKQKQQKVSRGSFMRREFSWSRRELLLPFFLSNRAAKNVILSSQWMINIIVGERAELITMTSRIIIIITNLICCRKISFPVSIELIITVLAGGIETKKHNKQR